MTQIYPDDSLAYPNQDSRIDEFKNLINKSSQSFLLNFPPIPFTKVIYGCYEANAQFNYAYSTDFDKTLWNVNFILCRFLIKFNFF